jgi:hypothetical protein
MFWYQSQFMAPDNGQMPGFTQNITLYIMGKSEFSSVKERIFQ